MCGHRFGIDFSIHFIQLNDRMTSHIIDDDGDDDDDDDDDNNNALVRKRNDDDKMYC